MNNKKNAYISMTKILIYISNKCLSTFMSQLLVLAKWFISSKNVNIYTRMCSSDKLTQNLFKRAT